MDIKVQAMGDYQTNCYIATIDGKDLIIDPGMDSLRWIKTQVTNPIAILNTHGHFDHVWSNAEVQKEYNGASLLVGLQIACDEEGIT